MFAQLQQHDTLSVKNISLPSHLSDLEIQTAIDRILDNESTARTILDFTHFTSGFNVNVFSDLVRNHIVDISKANSGGFTPLEIAAAVNNSEIYSFILAQPGLQLSVKNQAGNSVFENAISTGVLSLEGNPGMQLKNHPGFAAASQAASIDVVSKRAFFLVSL